MRVELDLYYQGKLTSTRGRPPIVSLLSILDKSDRNYLVSSLVYNMTTYSPQAPPTRYEWVVCRNARSDIPPSKWSTLCVYLYSSKVLRFNEVSRYDVVDLDSLRIVDYSSIYKPLPELTQIRQEVHKRLIKLSRGYHDGSTTNQLNKTLH